MCVRNFSKYLASGNATRLQHYICFDPLVYQSRIVLVMHLSPDGVVNPGKEGSWRKGGGWERVQTKVNEVRSGGRGHKCGPEVPNWPRRTFPKSKTHTSSHIDSATPSVVSLTLLINYWGKLPSHRRWPYKP